MTYNNDLMTGCKFYPDFVERIPKQPKLNFQPHVTWRTYVTWDVRQIIIIILAHERKSRLYVSSTYSFASSKWQRYSYATCSFLRSSISSADILSHVSVSAQRKEYITYTKTERHKDFIRKSKNIFKRMGLSEHLRHCVLRILVLNSSLQGSDVIYK